MEKKIEVKVKMPEEVIKGVYSNNLMISHTREEFVLDFMNIFHSGGIVTSRVITSPGHIKRILKAIKTNLDAYEKKHGQVQEAAMPQDQKIGIVH